MDERKDWRERFCHPGDPKVLAEADRDMVVATEHIRRALNGVDLTNLSDRTGLGRAHLGRIKYGDENLGGEFLETLEEIRRTLGIKIKDFYGDV